MALIHIKLPDEADIMYCSHPAAEAWTSDEDEASCADCVKYYLQEKLREAERVLTDLVNHNAPVPGAKDLVTINLSTLTRAEIYFGTTQKKP